MSLLGRLHRRGRVYYNVTIGTSLCGFWARCK